MRAVCIYILINTVKVRGSDRRRFFLDTHMHINHQFLPAIGHYNFTSSQSPYQYTLYRKRIFSHHIDHNYSIGLFAIIPDGVTTGRNADDLIGESGRRDIANQRTVIPAIYRELLRQSSPIFRPVAEGLRSHRDARSRA